MGISTPLPTLEIRSNISATTRLAREDILDQLTTLLPRDVYFTMRWFGAGEQFARARIGSVLTQVRRVKEPFDVHRYTTDGEGGPFVAIEHITDVHERIRRLALPDWNTGEVHTTYTLQPGTLIFAGTAVPLFGQPGGATQLYVPAWETHMNTIKHPEAATLLPAT